MNQSLMISNMSSDLGWEPSELIPVRSSGLCGQAHWQPKACTWLCESTAQSPHHLQHLTQGTETPLNSRVLALL